VISFRSLALELKRERCRFYGNAIEFLYDMRITIFRFVGTLNGGESKDSHHMKLNSRHVIPAEIKFLDETS